MNRNELDIAWAARYQLVASAKSGPGLHAAVIVQELIELINQSQATLAHYGDRFDRPFLITRALIHKLATPAPIKLIDTWRYAYKNLALTSNRLETISQALGCIHTKYKLAPEVWQLAQYGCGKSQKVMQEYCENDVDTLINVYQMILPLINDHPNVTMGGPGHCPACTAQPPRVQSRGYRYTKSFSVQRFECQHCHTWFDGRREKL